MYRVSSAYQQQQLIHMFNIVNFIIEHIYTCVEHIKAYEDRLSAAILLGQSVTCDICLDTVLPENLLSCADGHPFCRQCVASAAEVAVESAKSQVDCLDPDCPSEFPLHSLEAILPPRLYAILDRRFTEQSVLHFIDDMDDLVKCPFCPYVVIMENPDDKVFRCKNPECLRESCR